MAFSETSGKAFSLLRIWALNTMTSPFDDEMLFIAIIGATGLVPSDREKLFS